MKPESTTQSLRRQAIEGLAGFLAFLALLIAWSANLFNFMDGSDGLAALMAICGFAAYGAAAWLADEPAALYAALAAAVVPFLAVNVPPARAFMGDVGAVPLGWECVNGAQQKTDCRWAKKFGHGHPIDLSPHHETDKKWIEMTNVIRCQQKSPGTVCILRPEYLNTRDAPEYEPYQ